MVKKSPKKLFDTKNGKVQDKMIVCEITIYATMPSEESRSRHLNFLREWGAKGKLLMAGRFADSKGGMILWKGDSLEEIKEICKIDPYVKEGLLKNYELREWPVLLDYTKK
ncbi:MAG: YciI family protein [Nitrososphaerales archaeon]